MLFLPYQVRTDWKHEIDGQGRPILPDGPLQQKRPPGTSFPLGAGRFGAFIGWQRLNEAVKDGRINTYLGSSPLGRGMRGQSSPDTAAGQAAGKWLRVGPIRRVFRDTEEK